MPVYLSRVARVATDFWITLESPWPPLFDTLRVLTVAAIPEPSRFLARWPGIPGYRLGRLVWMVPIVGALVVVALGHRRMSRRALLALLALYAAPIVGLTLASVLVRPVLIPRVLLPVSIPLVLVLGAMADASRRVGAGITRRRCSWQQCWRSALLWAAVGDGTESRVARGIRFLQSSVGPADTLFFSVGTLRRIDSPVARINVAARTVQLLVRRYDPEARLGMVPQITLREAAGQCGGEPADCLDRSLGHLAAGRVVWMIRAYEQPLPACAPGSTSTWSSPTTAPSRAWWSSGG